MKNVYDIYFRNENVYFKYKTSGKQLSLETFILEYLKDIYSKRVEIIRCDLLPYSTFHVDDKDLITKLSFVYTIKDFRFYVDLPIKSLNNIENFQYCMNKLKNTIKENIELIHKQSSIVYEFDMNTLKLETKVLDTTITKYVNKYMENTEIKEKVEILDKFEKSFNSLLNDNKELKDEVDFIKEKIKYIDDINIIKENIII